MKEEGRKVAEHGRPAHRRHRAPREPAASTTSFAAGPAGRATPARAGSTCRCEDDLMRIFAGEWVAGVLDPARHGGGRGHREPMVIAPHRGGPEEGRGAQLRHPQEPARIRRGHGPPAQARSTASARRSSTAPTARCRILRHDRRADRRGRRALPGRRLRRRPASPSSRRNRLGVEFDAGDFAAADFEEADRVARDKATADDRRRRSTRCIDENLGAEDDHASGTGRRWPTRSTRAGA